MPPKPLAQCLGPRPAPAGLGTRHGHGQPERHRIKPRSAHWPTGWIIFQGSPPKNGLGYSLASLENNPKEGTLKQKQTHMTPQNRQAAFKRDLNKTSEALVLPNSLGMYGMNRVPAQTSRSCWWFPCFIGEHGTSSFAWGLTNRILNFQNGWFLFRFPSAPT